MDLILWRHAEAEDGVLDSARKLTPKGKRQAEKVASWLRKRLPKGYRLISSPAVRARETAEALSPQFEVLAEASVGSAPSVLLRALGWPQGEEAIVLVGHQPTLGHVASRVLAGEEMAWSVKKGAIWWIRSRGEDCTLIAVLGPDMA